MSALLVKDSRGIRVFHPLAAAAQHEAGHVIGALHFNLPLLEVYVREDGSGKTDYTRKFGLADCVPWVITTYAGGEAERDLFGGGQRADRSDLLAINNMLHRCRLDWDEDRLADLRDEARHLVQRQSAAIATVADHLIARKHMTAAEVHRVLGTSGI
jgi:hypothetical protein